MKTLLLTVSIFSVMTNYLLAQTPANDNCSNATVLIPNEVCINGTTFNSSTQSGEVLNPSCAASTFNQTVWYQFTANAVHMYVQLYVTGFSGSGVQWGPTRWSCVVYNSSSCLPNAASIISCYNSSTEGNGDAIIVNNLTGLTAGQVYLIQIGYRTGNGINKVPNFCISVGNNFTTDCSQCSSSCGNACGFSSSPSVSTVVNSCPSFPQVPYKEGGQSLIQCYSFVATSSLVSFNVVITSTCISGNVSNFNWTLQSASCGPVLQSGDLNNLTFSGLTVGSAYTFCYILTVPSSCYHESYYPYFVGGISLPVEVSFLTAEQVQDGIELNWITEAELNNDYFSIERSEDGEHFEGIAQQPGAGSSLQEHNYTWLDRTPFPGINYYRIVQHDYDGGTQASAIVTAYYTTGSLSMSVFPNPITDGSILQITTAEMLEGKISIFDLLGKVVRIQPVSLHNGINKINLDFDGLTNGMYQIQLDTSSGTKTISVIK